MPLFADHLTRWIAIIRSPGKPNFTPRFFRISSLLLALEIEFLHVSLPIRNLIYLLDTSSFNKQFSNIRSVPCKTLAAFDVKEISILEWGNDRKFRTV